MEKSINKILALKGTIKENTQLWYLESIEKGLYKFLSEGDANWDYYIDDNEMVYSIAKVEGCKSSVFGNLNYFKKVRNI